MRFASRIAGSRLARSFTKSIPMSKPAPRISPVFSGRTLPKSSFSFSNSFSPIAAARSARRSSPMIFRFAEAAAQASGVHAIVAETSFVRAQCIGQFAVQKRRADGDVAAAEGLRQGDGIGSKAEQIGGEETSESAAAGHHFV